jgi:hypothetical protein
VSDSRDYAAMATPVTSARAKARVRRERTPTAATHQNNTSRVRGGRLDHDKAVCASANRSLVSGSSTDQPAHGYRGGSCAATQPSLAKSHSLWPPIADREGDNG